MKKDRKQRNGVPGEIVVYTCHDWYGRVQDRIRAKTNEKEKGIAIIEKIETRFDITDVDRFEFNQKMLGLQEDAFTPTKVEGSLKDGQVKLTRDSSGKLVSPFGSKSKLKQ